MFLAQFNFFFPFFMDICLLTSMCYAWFYWFNLHYDQFFFFKLCWGLIIIQTTLVQILLVIYGNILLTETTLRHYYWKLRQRWLGNKINMVLSSVTNFTFTTIFFVLKIKRFLVFTIENPKKWHVFLSMIATHQKVYSQTQRIKKIWINTFLFALHRKLARHLVLTTTN
jgi:hypothetical protein